MSPGRGRLGRSRAALAQNPTGVLLAADEDEGRRSSSRLGREVVAAALAGADPAAAEKALQETEWRSGYPPHFRRLVEAGFGSPADALALARTGLTAVTERMRWCPLGGSEAPLGSMLETRPDGVPRTRLVRGSGAPTLSLVVPHGRRRLVGAELLEQLARWEDSGVLEPSAAAAVAEVVRHPEWLSLPGRRLVALGAGSEMGPLRTMLSWGAEVIGVDLPDVDLWAPLIEHAEGSAGILYLPESGSVPGVDLLSELPQLLAWLQGFEGPLVVGNYCYADGVTNLRLSAATDLLAAHLAAHRRDVMLAYLATPTDVFGVPAAVVDFSRRAYADGSGRLAGLTRRLSGGRLLRAQYPHDDEPGVADAVVPQQGPNYLLAKRIQRWRTTVARDAGTPVSMLVAPPTRTRSVTRNRALASAYAGAHRFGVEVFAPETSSTLMAALLVHDVMARPASPAEPWRAEAERAVHGGLWRGPYDPGSALGVAALLGAAFGR